MITLFVLHFISDFVFQTREMGKKKSEELSFLFAHLFFIFLLFLPFTSLKFSTLNCAIHGIIDWHIWKVYKAFVIERIKNDQDHDLLEEVDPFNMKPMKERWQYWKDEWFYIS